MNCQDLSAVLDSHGPDELSSAQKRDIAAHFASCTTCREAWAVYGEYVAGRIPKTPGDLHRRIAAALEEQEVSDAGRARRSIIFGSVLVVGAGLATALTLGLAQGERPCPRT